MPEFTATGKAYPQKPPFLACGLLLFFMLAVGTYTSRNTRIATDFRQFYAAGYMVRTHPSQLYDLAQQKAVQDAIVSPADIPLPYVHPSYEALFFAPLSFLKYRVAYLTFIAINVLLLLGCFFVAKPIFGPRNCLQAAPGLMLFLFVPAFAAIWQGQDSILFLLLCCWSRRELQKDHDISAACILALCLFRFQLALPIAVLLAIRRGWRFLAAFAAAAAAITLLSVGFVGRAATVSMLHLLAGVSLSGDQSAATQHAMAMHPLAMPNLFGLLYASGSGHLAPRIAFLVTAVASLAVFLWTALRMHREKRESVALSLAFLCAILVSQHLYLHDLTLLLLPLALLAASAPKWLLLTCYILPVPLFFFGGPNSLYLLAIPILALLFSTPLGADGARSVREA